MRPMILAAAGLALAACGNGNTMLTAPGGASFGNYSGRSQVEEIEAHGYTRQAYTFGMQLVPCMAFTGSGHKALTVAERAAYQRQNGGYLSDCGVADDFTVWG